jgi:hypothetical protein
MRRLALASALRPPGEMGPFVETWKQIAAVVQRSERWCRYMAANQVDPLPVRKVGGIVRLYVSDLDGWIARQSYPAPARRELSPPPRDLLTREPGVRARSTLVASLATEASRFTSRAQEPGRW